MAQSLSQIFVHIIFSTKHRKRLVKAETEPELFAYIASTVLRMKGIPFAVNGDADHLHLLSSLPRTVALSGFIEEIKKSSSRWIKSKDKFYRNFGWQDGYAAFSVSSSKKNEVIKYIAGQKNHHLKMTFQEELILFLDRYETDYNEKYIWD